MNKPIREYTPEEIRIRDEGRRIRLAKEREEAERRESQNPANAYSTATNADYQPGDR